MFSITNHQGNADQIHDETALPCPRGGYNQRGGGAASTRGAASGYAGGAGTKAPICERMVSRCPWPSSRTHHRWPLSRGQQLGQARQAGRRLTHQKGDSEVWPLWDLYRKRVGHDLDHCWASQEAQARPGTRGASGAAHRDTRVGQHPVSLLSVAWEGLPAFPSSGPTGVGHCWPMRHRFII